MDKIVIYDTETTNSTIWGSIIEVGAVVADKNLKEIGKLNITPSFAPGYYSKGDGKDLGHSLEFKSELQFSVDLFSTSQLGFSYNHLSNASLGSKNPGANSYMFNFMKQF